MVIFLKQGPNSHCGHNVMGNIYWNIYFFTCFLIYPPKYYLPKPTYITTSFCCTKLTLVLASKSETAHTIQLKKNGLKVHIKNNLWPLGQYIKASVWYFPVMTERTRLMSGIYCSVIYIYIYIYIYNIFYMSKALQLASLCNPALMAYRK